METIPRIIDDKSKGGEKKKKGTLINLKKGKGKKFSKIDKNNIKYGIIDRIKLQIANLLLIY